jgi:hypothetical protein
MDITYQIVNSEISATVILNRKRFIHNVTQRSYPFSLHIFVAIEKKIRLLHRSVCLFYVLAYTNVKVYSQIA